MKPIEVGCMVRLKDSAEHPELVGEMFEVIGEVHTKEGFYWLIRGNEFMGMLNPNLLERIDDGLTVVQVGQARENSQNDGGDL